MPIVQHNPPELYPRYRCYTHAPSSTVICCQLLDPRWKLEVEAMAAT